MKENIKKIEKILINKILIIVIIIAFIFGISFIQMKRNNTKYINICGHTVMQVATGSMSNTLNIKDIVIVKLTKDVDVNEIITYEKDNKLITHRVIEINNEKIITKGDANNSIDSPIKNENVIGKVIFIIPKIAVWQKVLTTPKVIVSGSITLCLLYFLSTSKDKRKEECIKKEN